MTQSMTAFARQQSEHDWGTLVWELRSVNHRYLEPSFKLPETLRHLEAKLRELLRKSVSRGKVEAQLKFSSYLSAQGNININPDVLMQLQQANQQIKKAIPDCSAINPLEILKWPGLVIEPEQNTKQMEEQSLLLFKESLQALNQHRGNEGSRLKTMIEQRLTSINEIVLQIRSAMPTILAAQKSRILDSCQNLKVEVDPSRIEQEIVLIAQKADIDEEVDRLDAHVEEVSNILNQNGSIGRRLDFLMQELNREANTICSKAIVTETTVGAIELKVLIEQMREQIQNIE